MRPRRGRRGMRCGISAIGGAERAIWTIAEFTVTNRPRSHLGTGTLDHRLYYVVGDFLVSLLIGVVAGLAAWAIVGPGWNMWAAMALMMPLGMVIGMLIYFPLGSRLGAMEAMIPSMYTGMWAGMVVGMMSAMMPFSMRHAAEMGAACGVAEIIFIWLANSILRGVTKA